MKKREPFLIHKNLRINDWIEIRAEGVTYLVAMSSLLKAYKEKKHGQE